MKINNFRGELTNISAKKEPLGVGQTAQAGNYTSKQKHAVFLAPIAGPNIETWKQHVMPCGGHGMRCCFAYRRTGNYCISLILNLHNLDCYLTNGRQHQHKNHERCCGLSTGTEPLFQILVWTTRGSSRAPCASVDTRFFAQSDSIVRGPTAQRLIPWIMHNLYCEYCRNTQYSKDSVRDHVG